MLKTGGPENPGLSLNMKGNKMARDKRLVENPMYDHKALDYFYEYIETNMRIGMYTQKELRDVLRVNAQQNNLKIFGSDEHGYALKSDLYNMLKDSCGDVIDLAHADIFNACNLVDGDNRIYESLNAWSVRSLNLSLKPNSVFPKKDFPTVSDVINYLIDNEE